MCTFLTLIQQQSAALYGQSIGPSLLILQFRYFYLFILYVIRKSFQISISFFLGESCPRRPTITMLHCFKLIIKHNINIHKTSHSQNNTRTSWRMLWTHIGRQNHSTSMCSDGHSMTKVQNKRALFYPVQTNATQLPQEWSSSVLFTSERLGHSEVLSAQYCNITLPQQKGSLWNVFPPSSSMNNC